jgi:uncharacterized membrane protein YfcA
MSGNHSTHSEQAIIWEWAGPACVVAAIAFLAGAAAAGDMLPPVFSPLIFGFFAWLPALVVALRQRQYWWAAGSLPFCALPIGFWLLLMEACSRGDCL